MRQLRSRGERRCCSPRTPPLRSGVRGLYAVQSRPRLGVDAWPVCAGRTADGETRTGLRRTLKNAPTDYPVFTLLSNVLLEHGDLLLQEAASDWRGPLGVTLMIGRSVFVAFAAEGAGGHVATVHGVPCIGDVAGHKGHEYRYPAHDFERELRRRAVIDGQRRCHIF